MANELTQIIYERVADTDPNRCQGIIHGVDAGQCHYKAVPGSNFCMAHGGSGQLENNKRQTLKNYKLQQYGERVGELSNNPEIKNLREEIGILRMVLEETLNQCKNTSQLLIYSDKIAMLVEKVQKLVECCQKLEEKNNNLLDRKVVIVIADSIVTLIGNYITDPDQLDEIGLKICASIEAAASPAAAMLARQ